jgi:hypothetical protein
LKCFLLQTIEKLPDKVLLNIFSYLSHREICRVARVCKKWRVIAYDTRLWRDVSLRPEVSGLHVGSLEFLLGLIRLVACDFKSLNIMLNADIIVNIMYKHIKLCLMLWIGERRSLTSELFWNTGVMRAISEQDVAHYKW